MRQVKKHGYNNVIFIHAAKWKPSCFQYIESPLCFFINDTIFSYISNSSGSEVCTEFFFSGGWLFYYRNLVKAHTNWMLCVAFSWRHTTNTNTNAHEMAMLILSIAAIRMWRHMIQYWNCNGVHMHELPMMLMLV